MTLPARRKPVRSGIARAPRREWPRHRAFIARLECVVCTADPSRRTPCTGRVRACHWRTAATAGTGLKSFDWQTWPGCDGHHAEEHRGTKSFEAKYGLNLVAIAAGLAARSPDLAMKAAMKEAGHG